MFRTEQSQLSKSTPLPTSALTPGSFALTPQTARMKFPVAALTLFLVATFLLPAQAQPGLNSACCFVYAKTPVPLRLLTSYEITSRCSLPAVKFFTKKNRQVCADPKEQWTQERMKQLTENGQQNNP